MVNLITLALPFLKRHGLTILAVVTALGCLWYIKRMGYQDCVQDTVIKEAKAAETANKGREKIDHETENLDRTELLDDLRSAGELRGTSDL